MKTLRYILSVLALLHIPVFSQVSLVIGSDSKLAISGETTIALSGDWQNNGEFDPGSGTVNFNGSSDQILAGAGDENFYNLMVDNSGGTLILNSTLTITNDLSLINGQVDNTLFPVILDDGATLTGGNGSLLQPPITYGRLTLWPPNHTYQMIDVSSFFGSNAVITSAASDEPEDAPGEGDGNTRDDIVISSDCQWVELRKERQETGNGRVYTVFVLLNDGSSALFRVIVPPEQSILFASLDATAYAVSGNCGERIIAAGKDGGTSSLGKTNPGQSNIPEDYSLNQNYPNPFNPVTTIRFGLPEEGRVTIEIYNIMGQKVRTLVNGFFPAGYHTIDWDATNDFGEKVASGIYIYRATAGKYTTAKKMMYLE